MNLYGFVGNSPLNWWDYLGMCPDGYESDGYGGCRLKPVIVNGGGRFTPQTYVSVVSPWEAQWTQRAFLSTVAYDNDRIFEILNQEHDLEMQKLEAIKSLDCTFKKLFKPEISDKISASLMVGTEFINGAIYSVALPKNMDTVIAFNLPGLSRPTLVINTAADYSAALAVYSYAGTQDQFISISIRHELLHAEHSQDPSNFAAAARNMGITGPVTREQEDAITRLQADAWAKSVGIPPIHPGATLNDYINDVKNSNNPAYDTSKWTAVTPGTTTLSSLEKSLKSQFNVSGKDLNEMGKCD